MTMETFPVMRGTGEREAAEEQKVLSLCQKGLTRLPPLGLFPWARILDVRGNRLLKLEGLEVATWVEELRVGQNRLVTLQGLANLPMLRAVNANDNSIVQISGLEGCSVLELLHLRNNNISSIDGLHALTRLRVLDLSCNHISTLPNLASCHSLRTLDLSGNFLSSLAPAPDSLPPGIQNLSLADNEIEEFAELKYLTTSTGLRELHLSGNPIAAIAAGRGIDIQPLVLFLLPRLAYLNGIELQRNGFALMTSKALFADAKGELSDDLLQLMGNGRQMDLIAYLVTRSPVSKSLRSTMDGASSDGDKTPASQASGDRMEPGPGPGLGNWFSSGSSKALWNAGLENRDPAPVVYRNQEFVPATKKGTESPPLTSNSALTNGTLTRSHSGRGTPIRSFEQVSGSGSVVRQDLLDSTAIRDARSFVRTRSSGGTLWKNGSRAQMAAGAGASTDETMAVDTRGSSESLSSTGWPRKQDRLNGMDVSRQSIESSMSVDGLMGSKNGIFFGTGNGRSASEGGLPETWLEAMVKGNEGQARVGTIKMVIDNLKTQVHDLQKAIDQLQGRQAEKGDASPARESSQDNPRSRSGKSSVSPDTFDEMKPGTPDRQQELPPPLARAKTGVLREGAIPILTSEGSDISKRSAESQELSIGGHGTMNRNCAEESGKMLKYATLQWVASRTREAVPLADVFKLGYKKEHNVAASKIQAWVVGNQVRARLARYHREQQAATAIQAVWRGVATRLKRQRPKTSAGIPRNLLQRRVQDLDAEASMYQRVVDLEGASSLAREAFEKSSQLSDPQSSSDLETLVRSVISDVNRLREQCMTLETKVALATDNRAFLEQVVCCLWDEMRAFRRWQDRCLSKEQGVAVVVIQRWWRGYQARQRVAKMKAEIEFQKELYLRRVITMQAIIRSHLHRKRFLQHMAEKKAAVKIQTAARGYLARKQFNKLREENQVEGLIKDVILLREEVDATRRWVMALATGFDPSSCSPKRIRPVDGRSRIEDSSRRPDPAPSTVIGCRDHYSRCPRVVTPLPSDHHLTTTTSVKISPVEHNQGFASTGVPPPSPSSASHLLYEAPAHATSKMAWSRGGMHADIDKDTSSATRGGLCQARAVKQRRSYCCCVCHSNEEDENGVSSVRGNLKRRIAIRDGGDAEDTEDGNNARRWSMPSPRPSAPSKWAKVTVTHDRHDNWQSETTKHHHHHHHHHHEESQIEEEKTARCDLHLLYGLGPWNCNVGDVMCPASSPGEDHENEVPLVNIGDDGMDSRENCATNGVVGSDELELFHSAGSGEDVDVDDGDGESLLGTTASFNHEKRKKGNELPNWLRRSQREVERGEDLRTENRNSRRIGPSSSMITGGTDFLDTVNSVAMDRGWVSIIDNRMFAFGKNKGGENLVENRWGGPGSMPGPSSFSGLVDREWSGSEGENQMDDYCCGSFGDSDCIRGGFKQWPGSGNSTSNRDGGAAQLCNVDVHMRDESHAVAGASRDGKVVGTLGLPHGSRLGLDIEEQQHNEVRENGVRETEAAGCEDDRDSSSGSAGYLHSSRVGEFELCEYNSDTSSSSYGRSSIGRDLEGGGLLSNRNDAANGGPRRVPKMEKCARRAGILQIVTLRRRAVGVISRSHDIL